MTNEDNWPHWQGAESLVCSASGNYAECELYWLIDGGHYCVEFKKFGATTSVTYHNFFKESDALHFMLSCVAKDYELDHREE
jgi:hypothetical protein